LRLRAFYDFHADLVRHDWRGVRNVILVAKKELQGVVASGERHFRFG
jgi:hypothetical protein